MPSIHATATKLASVIDVQGLTQEEIAIKLNISQSQISRVLAGKVTPRSKAYRRLCAFMRIEWQNAPARSALTEEGAPIALAIQSVWNGTEEHAEAIAGVIRSLGAFSTGR